jgi:hypothetical protein
MSQLFGRREFLLGLAAIPVVGALGACSGRESLRPALLEFYADRDSARALGAEYLKHFPDEDDDTILLEGLTGGAARASEWEELASSDPQALRQSIRQRHREDFRAGRTRLLSGWVLSETELRLCALVARAG